MFSTVLIANRGEIACRIIGTLRRLGIRSVAVFSDADAGARHVALADVAVRLGPAPAAQSYLDVDAVLAAARATGADAVHPGYGFLAENAAFAAACAEAGIVFIGPSAEAILVMGDKIAAKHAVEARGVPTVPGVARAGMTDDDLIAAAPGVGYPLLIKPSAGGGGKGMHVVTDAAGLPGALAAARREAAASFGDDTLFLERYLDSPRHIEVQVLADAHGAVVHLGERECSLQRRHQKVIEEAPSPLLDAETRERIGRAACETARSVDYRGAGTVEFIVAADRPDEFFFMEMNTRLQVEHPVTEEITGVDLVAAQLRIATGEPLGLRQEDVRLTGHSIEARLYAEDPAAGFLPTGGRVLCVRHPAGDGIRVDTALADGLDVSVDYDPMLAKIIATAPTRDEARRRLVAALGDTAVLGFATNIAFLRALLEVPAVVRGELDTGLIARELDGLLPSDPGDDALIVAALLLDDAQRGGGADGPEGSGNARAGESAWLRGDGWRLGPPAPRRLAVAEGPRHETVELTGVGAALRAGDRPASVARHGDRIAVRIGDTVTTVVAVVQADRVFFSAGGATHEVHRVRTDHGRGADALGDPELVSPMPGVVVVTAVADGAAVAAGDAVVVVEAMKMEHVVRAEIAGVVSLRVTAGDSVARGQTLAVVTPTQEEDA
ncbi:MULTISPECIES: acetyl/propionyl/methylcrotonyl-CoA carboxylase subunit alpha [unclassified Microbacterium]|uniref:acetyl/propionyl/methylcrotonyl-CoA carboxylase subunit alpha n=1 Tax=unclassified Microbacterium TaxID=2609290 RepID=UPI0038692736